MTITTYELVTEKLTNDGPEGRSRQLGAITESAARSIAHAAAEIRGRDTEKQMFLKFYRSGDGQRGYLNPDGSADVTGRSWL